LRLISLGLLLGLLVFRYLLLDKVDDLVAIFESIEELKDAPRITYLFCRSELRCGDVQYALSVAHIDDIVVHQASGVLIHR